jgi:hypothetical protein
MDETLSDIEEPPTQEEIQLGGYEPNLDLIGPEDD